MLILSRGFSRYIAQFSTENKWYFVLVYFCLFNYFCCLTMRSDLILLLSTIYFLRDVHGMFKLSI